MEEIQPLPAMRHANPMQFSGFQGAKVGPTASLGGSTGPKLAIPPMFHETMRQAGPSAPLPGAVNMPQSSGSGAAIKSSAFTMPGVSGGNTWVHNTQQFPSAVKMKTPVGKVDVPLGGKDKRKWKLPKGAKDIKPLASKHAGSLQQHLKNATGAL